MKQQLFGSAWRTILRTMNKRAGDGLSFDDWLCYQDANPAHTPAVEDP